MHCTMCPKFKTLWWIWMVVCEGLIRTATFQHGSNKLDHPESAPRFRLIYHHSLIAAKSTFELVRTRFSCGFARCHSPAEPPRLLHVTSTTCQHELVQVSPNAISCLWIIMTFPCHAHCSTSPLIEIRVWVKCNYHANAAKDRGGNLH